MGRGRLERLRRHKVKEYTNGMSSVHIWILEHPDQATCWSQS